jgi:hypothetical protein
MAQAFQQTNPVVSMKPVEPFCLRKVCGLTIVLILLLVSGFQAEAQTITVRDLGYQSTFQDDYLGHFKRGRALVAADFDLDGRTDFYMGNPGDESFILHNISANGRTRFEMGQVLVADSIAWGAAAADYDNDGDYDLFITCGANEGIGLNYLFKNMLKEEGALRFEDVSDFAGIRGPYDSQGNGPYQVSNANSVWGDYDLDGDVDIFVSVNDWGANDQSAPLMDMPSGISPTTDLGIHGDACGDVRFIAPRHKSTVQRMGAVAATIPDELFGRNILWRNNGDGTFTDVTLAAGLTSRNGTRHSTFFDYDNDGDLDLYENNHGDLNVLWRNNIIGTGEPTFTNASLSFVTPGVEDIRYPNLSFASCAADFNNDGWQDLVGFMRGEGPELGSPYPEGHTLFMNRGGASFVNVAQASGLNTNFISDPLGGVMGCMIEDVTGDGILDVYVGNGGPRYGVADLFFVGTNAIDADPVFMDRTSLIDYPVEQSNLVLPTYPYRTHGTAFADADGDGLPEIGVINGGPSFNSDEVQEPDRLFKLTITPRPNWLRIRPVGNGVTSSRDAIGTRLALTVRKSGGTPWTLHRTLYGGQCFSAQNGFDLFFGLRDANQVVSLQIMWPDGTQETITQGLIVNRSMVVEQGTARSKAEVYEQQVAALFDADTAPHLMETATAPTQYRLGQNYPNPFNPTTQIAYEVPTSGPVRIAIYDALGREVAVLVDQVVEAGRHALTWDAAGLPSGLYVYRLEAGTILQTQAMLLTK